MSSRPGPSSGRPLVILVGLFVASRLIAWTAGVRFDDSTLTWYWQFLDVELLRQDLARSLWYLHAQPPGPQTRLPKPAVYAAHEQTRCCPRSLDVNNPSL